MYEEKSKKFLWHRVWIEADTQPSTGDMNPETVNVPSLNPKLDAGSSFDCPHTH
jgi:hypothetical protein